ASLKKTYTKNLKLQEAEVLLEVHDERHLSGIPAHIVSAARERAQKRGLQGWAFSTKNAEYIPIISYADSPEIRRQIYALRSTLGDVKPYDNYEICRRIIDIRCQRAKLLGFESHAHYKLKDRSEVNPLVVLRTLNFLSK